MGVRAKFAVAQSSVAAPLPPAPWIFHRPTLPAGQAPTSVVTGDFNADGKVDFAVANAIDSTVWIYLGDGLGGFHQPRIIALAGITPVGMVAADLQHRGVLDLVVVEIDSSTVGTLKGNGDGTFQPEQLYATAHPQAVAVADFNDDGFSDVVTASIGVEVRLGDGSGVLGHPFTSIGTPHTLDTTFTPPPLTNVVVTDFNKDGRADLLVGSAESAAVVYLGDGKGAFPTFTTVQGSEIDFVPNSVAAADLNGDGCMDAAVSDAAFGRVVIYDGHCDGTFSFIRSQVFPGDQAAYIRLADVDGSGILSLISSGQYQNWDPIHGLAAGRLLTISKSDGAGSFAMPRVYDGAFNLVAFDVADFNNDGHPDVVAVSQAENSAVVFLNDGSGGFGDPQGFAVDSPSINSGALSKYGVADVDGDGISDIVTEVTSDPWQINVWRGLGGDRFADPVTTHLEPLTSGTPRAFVMGDFRGVGKLDWVGNANNEIQYAKNLGDSSFGPPQTVVGAVGDGIPLVVGDFNGDGRLDVAGVCNCFGQGTVAFAVTGNGDGTFSTPIITKLAGADFIDMLIATDLNHDGKLDLLVHYAATLEGAPFPVYTLFGVGNGTFTPVLAFPTLDQFSYRDVNGDGIGDLVTIKNRIEHPGQTTGITVQTFFGTTDGHFIAQAPIVTPYAGFQSNPVGFDQSVSDGPLLVDLNGDGLSDLLAAETVVPAPSEDEFVQYLTGLPDGTFAPNFIADLQAPTFFSGSVLKVGNQPTLTQYYGHTGTFVFRLPAAAPALQVSFQSAATVTNHNVGVVLLNQLAAQPVTVQLAASDTHAQIPASVTIPAGQSSATFPLDLQPGLDVAAPVTVTATLPSGSGTATTWSIAAGAPVTPLFDVVDFGIVRTQTTSVKSVQLTNNALAPVSITNVRIAQPAADYAISNGCGAALPAAGSCTLVVSLTPTVGQQQTEATLLFEDTASAHLHRIELTGLGGSPIFVTQPSLDFGDVIVGTKSTQAVTISNDGLGAAHVTGVAASAAFSSASTCGTVTAGGGCVVNVTFSPTALGSQSSQLTVVSDADNSPTVVTLTGRGVAGPIVQLSAASLTFSDQLVGTRSAQQTVTVTNTGTAALLISSFSSTGNFTETGCSTPVQPGGSCDLSVSFTPVFAGAMQESVVIASNAAAVHFTVTGNAEDFSWSNASATQLSVRSGESASGNLVLQPLSGFNGAVTFACLNLPAHASCSFAPSSLTLSQTSATTLLTISTGAQTLASTHTMRFAVLSTLALIGIAFVKRRRGTLLLLMMFAGCSGGQGGSSGGPSVTASATSPPGTYFVTVTASSQGQTRAAAVTLVVK